MGKPKDDPSADPDPGQCEKCLKFKADVMFDRNLERYLCHWCWFHTPPRGPV